jgi:hypothetical protein
VAEASLRLVVAAVIVEVSLLLSAVNVAEFYIVVGHIEEQLVGLCAAWLAADNLSFASRQAIECKLNSTRGNTSSRRQIRASQAKCTCESLGRARK